MPDRYHVEVEVTFKEPLSDSLRAHVDQAVHNIQLGVIRFVQPESEWHSVAEATVHVGVMADSTEAALQSGGSVVESHVIRDGLTSPEAVGTRAPVVRAVKADKMGAAETWTVSPRP